MKIKTLVVTVALTLLAAAASAGFQQPAPVTIDMDLRIAEGDQTTARIAKDDVTMIGCGYRVFDDGLGAAFEFGFCQARDADEVDIICNTFNPALIDAMKGTGEFGFLTFSWNENGECTRVGASKQSFYLPNFTTKGKN